eukprot:TRINITY_DN107354_c0_g1_i1.p1 TRINITY_DN107354_c0_g1~~TRINITY_DN107354_c0_g1_i1.p1  ORF type:complete len:288 (+),score=57.30 TRINITY_DN107354_c0_g1_i1:52-915(+)
MELPVSASRHEDFQTRHFKIHRGKRSVRHWGFAAAPIFLFLMQTLGACRQHSLTLILRSGEAMRTSNLRQLATDWTRRAALHAVAAAPFTIPGLEQAAWGQNLAGRSKFKSIETQYIAALGDPKATTGTGAETWGLWSQDPGPRGVKFWELDKMKARGGMAPARWKFDSNDWWLEEHGLLMEKPAFPLAAGRYLVTGDRDVTAVLTVSPKDPNGTQRWELSDGARLFDVTHLPCRSARYTPESDGSCMPFKELELEFPVEPGAEMPAVQGCKKQDYAVLFVVGVEAK